MLFFFLFLCLALQQIDKMPWTSLRPEFRRAMDELQSKVFAEVPIKKVFGKSIDGKGNVPSFKYCHCNFIVFSFS
jgi:hypothetical protein